MFIGMWNIFYNKFGIGPKAITILNIIRDQQCRMYECGIGQKT